MAFSTLAKRNDAGQIEQGKNKETQTRRTSDIFKMIMMIMIMEHDLTQQNGIPVFCLEV